MATRGIYYFDGLSFALARSLFTDSTLDTLAPDGYYTLGTISRKQVGGLLESAVTCPACGDAFYLCYDADSAYDVCCPGCTETLTGFDSTTVGNFLGVCDIHPSVTYYHNGSGVYPVANDLVFTDINGTTPLPNGWYHYNTPSNKYRITNGTGFVATNEPC